MALSVVMPALEMAQETGKVVSWRKGSGDLVRKGEPLLEVETDKAVVEIEAEADGILGGVSADVGDVVAVGGIIAWLLAPGEAVPVPTAPTQTGRRSDASQRPANIPGVPDIPSGPSGAPSTDGRPAGTRISPKARKLAQEHGVDLAKVRGSGPGGEILADDITKAAAGRTGQPSAIGRLMAERTTQSWTTVPHFFVSREVDASRLVNQRDTLVASAAKSNGPKPTYTDLIVAAVARVLRKHPRLCASWVSGAVRMNPDMNVVNIGLAMAVDDGVVAAVIPNAGEAAVAEIAAKRHELAERARENRLQPADLTGATFTISNLGMYEVDAFTAIIVPPQAAILAVGAISNRVVARDGQVVIRPAMTITLSCDHRVVDGARAAAFLNDLVAAFQKELPFSEKLK